MSSDTTATNHLPGELAALIAARYDVTITSCEPMLGGYDTWARKWLAETSRGELVIRADARVPAGSGQWTGQMVASANRAGVPCMTPLRTQSGRFAVGFEGGAVSLMGYALGQVLDRNNAREVESAATALARLHTRVPLPRRDRPSPSPWDARFFPGDHDPEPLLDAGLDSWQIEFAQSGRDRRRGLVHGDFYAANMICRNEAVVAIIDWAEARVDIIARELAFSIWEFGHNEAADALEPDRARTFVAAYRRAVGGTLEPGFAELLVPLMRAELRVNVRYALAAHDPPEAYIQAGYRAFAALVDLDAAALLA